MGKKNHYYLARVLSDRKIYAEPGIVRNRKHRPRQRKGFYNMKTQDVINEAEHFLRAIRESKREQIESVKKRIETAKEIKKQAATQMDAAIDRDDQIEYSRAKRDQIEAADTIEMLSQRLGVVSKLDEKSIDEGRAQIKALSGYKKEEQDRFREDVSKLINSLLLRFYEYKSTMQRAERVQFDLITEMSADKIQSIFETDAFYNTLQSMVNNVEAKAVYGVLKGFVEIPAGSSYFYQARQMGAVYTIEAMNRKEK